MTQASENKSYYLERDESGILELKKNSSKEKIHVDFLSGEFQQRLKTLSKSQVLFKAMAIEKGDRVLDATAGFGKDALSFCHMGASVLALEENSMVFALLEDGLKRAFENEIFKKKFYEKIKIKNLSSVTYMRELDLSEEERPHSIYLDPMYPIEEKSALPKKEMAFLRDILSETKNIEEMLSLSLKVALKRVVIKRPIGSPAIGKVSHSFESKLVRFDMYLMNQRII